MSSCNSLTCKYIPAKGRQKRSTIPSCKQDMMLSVRSLSNCFQINIQADPKSPLGTLQLSIQTYC